MFEKFLKKFRYFKLTEDEEKLLDLVSMSSINNDDLFIDSVKSTGTQKIYVKKGNKSVFVDEIDLLKNYRN